MGEGAIYSRRTILAGAAALAIATQARAATGKPTPTVSALVGGGRRGWPFSAYVGDIGKLGYVESEYFLAGEASVYQAAGELTPDGRWTIEPARTAPYKTRLLVRRPRDPRRFNGTVVVEWANVSTGFDVPFCAPEGIYDGFAYVLVSAQRHGVHGFPTAGAQGLLQWDPERYAGLSIPDDGLSYDIFTQAARVVGPARSRRGVDPMGGLKVRRLVAAGASQSGGRLMSYLNAVQPRDKAFDAIIPVICAGSAVDFKEGADAVRTGGGTTQVRFTRVRDDLATPVLALNTETEAEHYAPIRQPDSARFVSWEVAGASHICAGRLAFERQLMARDGVAIRWHPAPGAPDPQPCVVDWAPTFDAALRHVHVWMAGGPPPPSQAPIKMAGDKPTIVRDAYGNALGGVRLPEVEVPTGANTGIGEGLGRLLGRTTPMTSEQLVQLYPTHSDYVAKVKAAAAAAEKSGVILPARTRAYGVAAEVAAIPG